MDKLEALEKRIAELEAEVARLKAMPVHVSHSHYHYAQPVYVQQPTWSPSYPQFSYGAGGMGSNKGAAY